jgi:putative ABC transport system permease protein
MNSRKRTQRNLKLMPMRRLWFEFVESCRIAGQQLAANRTRSFLTTLGVIIGIIAVTLMGTAIRGIDTGFDKSMALLGDDVLYVEQWPWTPGENDFWIYRNRPDIKLAMADELDRLIGATPNSHLGKAIAAPSTIETVTLGKRQVSNVYVMGTTNDYSSIGNTDCKLGRFLNESESRGGRNVCVIGLDITESLFPGQDPIDKLLRVGSQEFRVIGVFERQGSFLGLFSFDSQVVIPLAAYAKYFKANAEHASIRVKVKDRRQMSEARDELRGDFRRIRALLPEQSDNFEINEQQAFRSVLGPVKAGLAIAGLFITGLALFVGAIGIMNITFVSVKERTREIGTRKALGARRRTILLQFLIEAVSICLVGGLIGLGLAIALFAVTAKAFPSFPIAFAPELVVIAMIVSVLTGVVSGFAPAWQASRLSPVEALRYE